MPQFLPADVGQVPGLKGLQIWGKGADQNFGPSVMLTGSGAVEFHQNFKSFQHTT